MDVTFVKCPKSKLENLPIVDGQVIAITDRDEYYYDLAKRRHHVLGIEFSVDPPTAKTGVEGRLYVATGAKPGIYVFDEKAENFKIITGINTIEKTGNPDGNVVTDITASGDKLTITLGKFTTASQFEQHTTDIDNPHKVTAEQVGLGNVSNVQDSEREVKTATQLKTARTIAIKGDVAGNADFDGSKNVEIDAKLKDSGVTAGTYGPSADVEGGSAIAVPQITVDAKGRVTEVVTRSLSVPTPDQILSEGTAGQAAKLSTPRTIDGVEFDGSKNIHHRGTCSTASGTTAKTVSIPGFKLAAGAVAYVSFQYGNGVANATLNVNNTGAKLIKFNGANITGTTLAARSTYCFVYDGTYWQIVRSPVDPSYVAGDRYMYTGNGVADDWEAINGIIAEGLGRKSVRITLVGEIGSSSAPSTLNLGQADDRCDIELDCQNARLNFSGSLCTQTIRGIIKFVGLRHEFTASQFLDCVSSGSIVFDHCTLSGLGNTVCKAVRLQGGLFKMNDCEIQLDVTTTCIFQLLSSCVGQFQGNRMRGAVEIACPQDYLDFHGNIVDDNVYTNPSLDMSYNNIIIPSV